MNGLTKIERLAADHLARAHHRGTQSASTQALRDALEAKAPGAIERARARHERELDARRFEGNPPAWAKRMMKRWLTGGSLRWRRSRTKPYSSGHCGYVNGRIVVTSGSNEVDDRLTLAHELAHALAPWTGHQDDFYDVLCRIVRDEGMYRAALSRNRGEGAGLRRAARRARGKEVA